MSLMGTTKPRSSSYGVESRTQENDIYDSLSSDAENPDVLATKSLRSPYSKASSRAPKRIKRLQNPRTPPNCVAKPLKSTTSSKEYRRSAMKGGRVPLADLVSTQGPIPPTQTSSRHEEHLIPKVDTGVELSREHDEAPPKLGSDEESFDGGDIFTSTDQRQFSTLRKKAPRHDYEETTTEF